MVPGHLPPTYGAMIARSHIGHTGSSSSFSHVLNNLLSSLLSVPPQLEVSIGMPFIHPSPALLPALHIGRGRSNSMQRSANLKNALQFSVAFFCSEVSEEMKNAKASSG